jgi:hypothetical protein
LEGQGSSSAQYQEWFARTWPGRPIRCRSAVLRTEWSILQTLQRGYSILCRFQLNQFSRTFQCCSHQIWDFRWSLILCWNRMRRSCCFS